MKRRIWMSPEVEEAQRRARPLVALETSVFAQGLPYPHNLEVAHAMDAAVRESGSQPVLISLGGGFLRYGATPAQLEELCTVSGHLKVGCGDIPAALASGRVGATTVSATLAAADLVRIPVFATGGIGGIHRGWNQHLDISADLAQLARSRCLTVCSGMKSVLDVGATLEALEALGIPLVLLNCDHFPEFYCEGSPSPLGVRLDTPAQVAEAQRDALELLGRGLLVCQPCARPLPQAEVQAWITEALRDCPPGKAATPHLLGHLARASQGRTLESNCQLLVDNARSAGAIAAQLAS